MKTYQDFEKAKGEGKVVEFIKKAINEYRASDEYATAVKADEYDREQNTTVMNYVKYVYNAVGQKVPDFTAGKNRIASNFFHRLITQRTAYSLGNGISFANSTQDKTGRTVDTTKEKLGNKFDTVLYKAGRNARKHMVSYLFWNYDHAVNFKMTEFMPLFDEEDGSLKAGFRFWSLDWAKKPVTVVVYEQDGYEKYRTKDGRRGLDLELYEEKKSYKQKIAHNDIDPDEVVEESNYSVLPIIPLWGNSNRQSDLIGMRSKIDAYDLVKSGFANDLEECAEIYWIVSNAMGETDESLAKFRDRIKLNHIAVADTAQSPITPYVQDIPVNARDTLLKSLHDQIYEDYGALDVHAVAAGSTNDHLEAAYQPMDEEADDFEYQIIDCVQGILALMNIEDVPVFNRNRISNQKERTEMVMMAANNLDDETILKHLPFITPDEIPTILMRKDKDDQDFIKKEEVEETEEIEEENELNA